MDLREKVAKQIRSLGPPMNVRNHLSLCMADAILAIPEIAEAQKRIAELEANLESAQEDADGYRKYPDSWA